MSKDMLKLIQLNEAAKTVIAEGAMECDDCRNLWNTVDCLLGMIAKANNEKTRLQNEIASLKNN